MDYNAFNTIYYVNIVADNRVYISDFGYSENIDTDFLKIINLEKDVILGNTKIDSFTFNMRASDYDLYSTSFKQCTHMFQRKHGNPVVARELAFSTSSKIQYIQLKSLYQCGNCSGTITTESIYKIIKRNEGGDMNIFDTLKNPFKEMFPGAKNKKREQDLLTQFDDSMQKISLIETDKPEEVVDAYLDLYKIGLKLSEEQIRNLLSKLISCCRRINRIGLALFYACSVPLHIDDQNANDQFKQIKLDLVKEASYYFQNHKLQIKILIINKVTHNANIDPIVEIITRECFQECIGIQSIHYYNELKYKEQFKEYDLVILSSNIFEKSDILINEYFFLTEKYPEINIFVTAPLGQSRFINSEFKEIDNLIIHNDKFFLYAGILIGLENRNDRRTNE